MFVSTLLFCVALLTVDGFILSRNAFRKQHMTTRTQQYATIVNTATNESNNNATSSSTTTTTTTGDSSISSSSNLAPLEEEASLLVSQAKQLQDDIARMQNEIAESKLQQQRKEQAKLEQWIQDLLLVKSPNNTLSSPTQLLKTVDQVALSLEIKRYSPEQVYKIFNYLTRDLPKQRIDQSLDRQPLIQLLVEACNLVDCLERDENDNKRWDGRVERNLRKKLFAMEWGIDLDLLEKENNSQSRIL
jgi:hypothetical protein